MQIDFKVIVNEKYLKHLKCERGYIHIQIS